jgi:hypothetical protein
MPDLRRLFYRETTIFLVDFVCYANLCLRSFPRSGNEIVATKHPWKHRWTETLRMPVTPSLTSR